MSQSVGSRHGVGWRRLSAPGLIGALPAALVACQPELSPALKSELCPTTRTAHALAEPLPWGPSPKSELDDWGEEHTFTGDDAAGASWPETVSATFHAPTGTTGELAVAAEPSTWDAATCGPAAVFRIVTTANLAVGTDLVGTGCAAVVELVASDPGSLATWHARCVDVERSTAWVTAHPEGADDRGVDVILTTTMDEGRVSATVFRDQGGGEGADVSQTLLDRSWGTDEGVHARIWLGELGR